MPRCKYGRCDDRLSIRERKQSGVVCDQPIGFGGNQCRKNYLVISVSRYVNDNAGGVDHVGRVTKHLYVPIRLFVG